MDENVKELVDLNCRTLADLLGERVKYVSFENTDNLQVYLKNLDKDDKTIVTDNINDLTLSGRMYETSSDLEFFIRNTFINDANVAFDNFIAKSPIRLINIQDVDTGWVPKLRSTSFNTICSTFSVRVENSAFDDIDDVEFIRVRRCETGSGSVSCNQNDLFISDVSLGKRSAKFYDNF